MIVIVCDGGLVQDVCSDEPALIGTTVHVVDYDTEGADEWDVEKIPQNEQGKTTDAFVSQHVVIELRALIAKKLKELS